MVSGSNSPTDPYGTIVQDNGSSDPVSAATGYVGMNQIDTNSQTFIDNALVNASLLSRLGGLINYRASITGASNSPIRSAPA